MDYQDKVHFLKEESKVQTMQCSPFLISKENSQTGEETWKGIH